MNDIPVLHLVFGTIGFLCAVCFVVLFVWHFTWGRGDPPVESEWDNAEHEVMDARAAWEAQEQRIRNDTIRRFLTQQSDCVCGLCGRPGATKIPSPLHWPNEKLSATAFVHPACERAEVERAFQELHERGHPTGHGPRIDQRQVRGSAREP